MVIITLKTVRKRHKMTLIKLSKASGVSKAEICKIENNDIMPRLDTLCELAYALDVNINELFIYQKNKEKLSN